MAKQKVTITFFSGSSTKKISDILETFMNSKEMEAIIDIKEEVDWIIKKEK